MPVAAIVLSGLAVLYVVLAMRGAANPIARRTYVRIAGCFAAVSVLIWIWWLSS
jgi:hypothetical protein